MPENREEQAGAKDEQTQEARVEAQGANAAAPELELNLEDLDLTVETVEERISPSETNVFDK